MDGIEILGEGYAVEWFDPAYQKWMQRGPNCVHKENARSLANKLFKMKYGAIDVRVIYREVVYNLRKT